MRVTTRKQHLINENDECIRTKRSFIIRIQQSLSGSVCCRADVPPGSSTSIDACRQCSASKSPSPMLVSTRTNRFVLHSISFRKYCCRACYYASTVYKDISCCATVEWRPIPPCKRDERVLLVGYCGISVDLNRSKFKGYVRTSSSQSSLQLLIVRLKSRHH